MRRPDPSQSSAFRSAPTRPSRLQAVLLGGSLLLAAASAPRDADAHGGLPVAQSILVRSGEMLVPTPYWGIFLGRDGGDWRWICDEAINLNQQRRLALAADGQTLYATDRSGLTVSPDSGCSWNAVTGPLAMLDIVAVVADPVQPARAYALANDSQNGSMTGLWKTEDRGQTWTTHVPLAMQLPAGLVVSPDGMKVAATTVTSTTPRTATLHEIGPTGPVQSRALTLMLDGQPLIGSAPLGYDGTSLYLRSNTDAGYALHRLDGSTSTMPTRLMQIRVPIHAISRAPQGSLLIATAEGIYQEQAGQMFKLLPTLSMSQCLSVVGGNLYSCAWNYAPDLAAIARLTPDLSSFTKVFQYSDTKGPMDCPATTAVGKICPAVWASYADQLGVTLSTQTDMGVEPTAPDGCSCSLGSAPRGTPITTPLGSSVGLLALGGLLLLRRRRRVPA